MDYHYHSPVYLFRLALRDARLADVSLPTSLPVYRTHAFDAFCYRVSRADAPPPRHALPALADHFCHTTPRPLPPAGRRAYYRR